MQTLYSYKRIAADYLEDHFILFTLLRYLFHLIIVLLFIVATVSLYIIFQNYLLLHLSTITYHDDENPGVTILVEVIIFMMVGYLTAYRSLKKKELSEYYIPFVLLEYVLWLAIATFIAINYNDLAYKRGSVLDIDRLNSFFLAIIIITVRRSRIETYLKKRNSNLGFKV
jgi:hypothetical protein